MAIFRCFLLLLSVRFGIIAARSSQDACQPARCRDDGPQIMPPFRLKGRQPECCGYHEFELSCNAHNQTLLQLLPSSVKFLVIGIDYKSQQIQASALDSSRSSCLPRQLLNLDFSASPFRLWKSYYNDFYNCSPPKREDLGGWVPCLSSVSGFHVYTMSANNDVTFYPLTSCTKIGTIASVLYDYHYEDNSTNGNITIPWLKPDSRNCDADDIFCASKITGCEHKREDAIQKLKLAGIILGCFFLLLAVIAFCYLYMSNKVEKENQAKIEKFLEDYKALRPARYSYADIKQITNQFREKLGEGGYGTVYKGILSHEIFVAVKVLNNSKENGEDFINEVGTIGKIHHVNVVRLVGFCADGFIRALVYEFLPNDSLEKYIFSDNSKNHHLGWERLQHIALGIAKGIEYLHQGCDQRILHFDIKPHNILLDHNFNPKISDFGLAKLCSKEQSAVSMTAARGTMGYIAPEVLSRNFGKVSYKSDVYSYGMLLLEMVGGRKNNDVKVENISQMYFPEWIYNRLEQGEELRIRIEEDGDDKIVKKLTIVGLWCIQWNPVDRPSMKVVIQMLEDDIDSLAIPPNPFSTGNASRPGSYLEQELAIISELE